MWGVGYSEQEEMSGICRECVRNVSGTVYRLMSRVGRGTSMLVTISRPRLALLLAPLPYLARRLVGWLGIIDQFALV